MTFNRHRLILGLYMLGLIVISELVTSHLEYRHGRRSWPGSSSSANT
jgi:hypothetical protein